MKKNFKRIIAVIGVTILVSYLSDSCSNDEVMSNESSVNQVDFNESYLQKIRIKFMIGLSANLERPSKDCKDGFGICEVTIGIVNIGVEKAANINMGVSDDNFLHFEIDGKDLEENSIKIESGDEFINIGQEVKDFFNKEELDISNIKLVKGEYNAVLDVDSGKYLIKIPFEKI